MLSSNTGHCDNDDYPSYHAKPAIRDWRQLHKLKPNTVITKSGRQQLPEDPYQWWLKPSGNVVALTVYSTRNLKMAIDAGRYRAYITQRSLQAGFLPWIYAEACELIPRLLADRGITTEAQWNTYRDQERAERQAKQAEGSAQYNKIWNSEDARQAMKSQEAMSIALANFTAKIGSLLESSVGDRPTRRKERKERVAALTKPAGKA